MFKRPNRINQISERFHQMHERIPKSLEEEIMNESSVFLKRKEKKEKFQNDEELDID